MEKFKNLLSSVIQNLVYDFVKKSLVFIFSSGISFPLFYLSLKRLDIPFWCVITFSVGLVAMVVLFALSIYQKLSYKYVASKRVDSDYSVVNKTVKFTYGLDRSYYESEITLLFNKKAGQYYGKYYWSGSGDGDIKVLNPNYRLSILKKRTRYIEYVINFDRIYKRGRKQTFKLKGTMHDPNHTFSPYFSTSIEVPTKQLCIILDIDPEKHPISDVEKEIISPGKYNHEDCEPVILEPDGTYKWIVKAPQVGCQYSLSWSFKK